MPISILELSFCVYALFALTSETFKKIAIVGGGVSGIVSAYLLSQKHKVSLFEKNSYLGGHTNTIEIQTGSDSGLCVDTGFIVFNDKNYPLFERFLEALDVSWRWSDMSFSYFNEKTDYQYAGTGFSGLFSQKKNIVQWAHWKMLFEIVRFCKRARQDLFAQGLAGLSLEAYLYQRAVSKKLIDHYLLPMGASIWSAPKKTMLQYPAQQFFQFFENHGLLSLEDRPRWRTVVGGSSAYVKAFKKMYSGELSVGKAVKSIRREDAQVYLDFDSSESRSFDAVVVATHADQSLRLLADPDEDEKKLLGAWSYQKNRTYLHTDISYLPSLKASWASWNFIDEKNSSSDQPATLTYHMNRLQGLQSSKDYCVTLNPARVIPSEHVIKELMYEHPIFDQKSVPTQEKISERNGKRNTYYCGSYLGYGFHEDAVRSAVEVANSLGVGF